MGIVSVSERLSRRGETRYGGLAFFLCKWILYLWDPWCLLLCQQKGVCSVALASLLQPGSTKIQVALSNTLKLALMEKEEWFGISCVSRLQEESQISQKTQKDPGGRCEMHYFKENPSQFISSRPVRPYFIGSRGLATVYQSNYSLCIAAQSYFCDRITTLHQ